MQDLKTAITEYKIINIKLLKIWNYMKKVRKTKKTIDKIRNKLKHVKRNSTKNKRRSLRKNLCSERQRYAQKIIKNS